MLRKIWNTLRYGDGRTKGFLISVMVLALAAVGFGAAALLMHFPLFWVAAAAAALITAALAKDTALVVIKDNAAREAMGEEAVKAEMERRKALKQQKRAEKKEKKAEDRKNAAEKDDEEREKADEEDFGEDALSNMTEAKMKKLFVRYKVKQEHVPVVVDLCVPERIKQCPAFAWLADGKLKLLLIESKPRLVERSCRALEKLEVERGIAVRASEEYAELRRTDLMSRLFTPYLPRYHKKTIGGRTVLLKNLYLLDGDIKFASGSVNQLKKLLPLRIELKDRRMQESAVGAYYKELFLSSFLWQDGILTLGEYQKDVERILESMASADISYSEFEKELSEMISSGLLPAEYRNFAYAKREQKKAEPKEKKGKKKK